MTGDSIFMMKIINSLPLKIEVVKFDDKNNFEMWRCEVMDALTASNLEDTLWLEKKRETTSEEDLDKMNRTAYDFIRSYFTQDIKYHVLYETPARQLWEILKKKYLTEGIESRLQLKRRLYRF